VRIVYRAITLASAVFLILFALPLYLLFFLSLLIGALIGVSVAWISGRRRRRELQRHRRRIEALERELSATQSQLENQAESVRPRLPASS
jgi:O-antigen/teichoic acid export membrane protein